MIGLVPPASGHRYEGRSDDSELLVIDLALQDPCIDSLEAACDLNIADTLFRRTEILTLDPAAMPLLEFAASRLQQKTGREASLVNYQLISLFMTQLCQLYRGDNPGRYPRRLRLDATLINRLIDERLADPPRVGDLAAAVNLSESQFYLLFQQQFGQTPQQYVVNRRLQHAHRLLQTSSMPLAAVALEVGFADASSFSRAFKSRFAVAPGCVRRHGCSAHQLRKPE